MCGRAGSPVDRCGSNEGPGAPLSASAVREAGCELGWGQAEAVASGGLNSHLATGQDGYHRTENLGAHKPEQMIFTLKAAGRSLSSSNLGG